MNMNAHEFKDKLKKVTFNAEIAQKAVEIVDEALEQALKAPSSYTENRYRHNVYLGGAMGSELVEEYKKFPHELLRKAVLKEALDRGFGMSEVSCSLHESQRDGNYITLSLHWFQDEDLY